MRNLGIVASIIGAIMAVFGYYKYDDANGFIKALNDGADLFGRSNSMDRSIDVWQGNADNYKMLLIFGLIVFVIGIILLISGIVSRTNKSNMQQASIHQEPFVAAINNNANITDRLQKLDELKEKGFISEEEYATKKKDIISSL